MRKAIVCLLAPLACSSARPPEPAPSPAPQAAPVAAAASDERQPEAAQPPKSEAERQPEAERQLEPEPGARTSPEPPTKKQALVASRRAFPGKLAQLAPILPLADGRAAVVWRHIYGESDFEAAVALAVLKLDGDAWTVDGSVQVLDASAPWIGEDAPPPLAVTAKTQDYDDDGEPEVLIRVRHSVMCPGGGPNTITSLDVFDVTPKVAEALSTELHHALDAYPEDDTKATVKHVDLDGDGHRDVEIAYASNGKPKQTNRWYYVPKADAWSLRRPEYERWGCDW